MGDDDEMPNKYSKNSTREAPNMRTPGKSSYEPTKRDEVGRGAKSQNRTTGP